MRPLSIGDFAAYFEDVHGKKPFPWQERLLRTIASSASGRWPELLDLPTGSGKTSAIDIALFHLALEADKPREAVTAPRRIVVVVDRRTVVEQAFERAKAIKARLDASEHPVVLSVRERLRQLSGGDLGKNESTLTVVQLRGGIPRDNSWVGSPIQPTIAVSTVDQVGSRLLFRGYGVTDTMRPVHAGLLGNDTLVLLDEVHLARPFEQTLGELARYRQWHRERRGSTDSALPDRWQVVPMSATADAGTEPFRLDDEDRAHPVLRQRLEASKPVVPQEVKVSGTDSVRRRQFAEVLAKRAMEQCSGNRAIGIVVNRVATALEIYSVLRDALEKKKDSTQLELATGRMRALDRNELDSTLMRRLGSGWDRGKEQPPIIVVATQCIEAGADFDFDVLVTECASLDALRQRFGRLNRLGSVEQPTPGFVFARSDSMNEKEPDPIYGHALRQTWEWLSANPRDFGIQASDAVLAPLFREKVDGVSKVASMLPPRPEAPIMFPTHLDLWAQTSQVPRPDPDISFWLHGRDQRADADVQIVWRADVEGPLAHIDAVAGTPDALESLRARVEVCPPSTLEALSVPISAARAWLRGPHSPIARQNAADFGDVDNVREEESDRDQRDAPPGRPALAWRGDESKVVFASELRPGMTIVVPTSYGGLLQNTWDPSSAERVQDRGDEARWVQTRRAVLRLHPDVIADWGVPLRTPAPVPAIDDDEAVAQKPDALAEWLEQVETPANPQLAALVSFLSENRRRRRLVAMKASTSGDETAGYFVVVGRRPQQGGIGDASTETNGSSLTGVNVTLTNHMKGVAAIAEQFGRESGLSERLVTALRVAGRWHDAGKADPRFQRWLRGGNLLAGFAAEPLAKSALVYVDREARRKARDRSGYPKGGRHELASLSLVEAGSHLLDEVAADDRDLVLHLVASHHGWCRPFAPVVQDPNPQTIKLEVDDGATVTAASDHAHASLGAGVPERYWALTEKYGWFGLAWLETLLRLADHRRSALEQKGEIPEDEQDESDQDEEEVSQ